MTDEAHDYKLNTVALILCDGCLDGYGGECHTPGCAMWLNRAPDLPLRDKVICELRFEMNEVPS